MVSVALGSVMTAIISKEAWSPHRAGLVVAHCSGDGPVATLHLVASDAVDAFIAAQDGPVRALLAAQGIVPGLPASERRAGRLALVAAGGVDDGRGEGARYIGLVEDPSDLGPWCLAPFATALPPGRYRLAEDAGEGVASRGALGWMLAQLGRRTWQGQPCGPEGDRREPVPAPRILLMAHGMDIARQEALARAVAMVRALVDAPANRLGPDGLEAVAAAIAARHGAVMSVTRGDALAKGFPLIHAVGRAAASERQPRLIELTLGAADAPRVAVVGKGISFDTGGLDIKSAAGMLLMKKDMGGAAHALALADLVWTLGLPIRLHCLLPIAENAVGPDAMRPGDILPSRHGRTVEVGNTDAEGRLVLADALTRAQEEAPGMIVDFATLTGAARVALGPDLPALFANDDALAADIIAGGTRMGDPVWRMPLWRDYADELKSDLADIGNHGASGLGGAIVGALFLDMFVARDVPFAHIDTFAWRPKALPGRPRGGAALGLLAVMAMLEARFGAADGTADAVGGAVQQA